MKKLISSVLVLVILLSFAIPAMAANDLQTMRASLLLDGGLKNGLTSDGVCGANTWAKLCEV